MNHSLFSQLEKFLNDISPRLETSLKSVKDFMPVSIESIKEDGRGLGHYEKTKLRFLGVEFVMKKKGGETQHYLLFDRDWHLLYEIT